jgi:outer membrane protein OmpA-like peptidoglycan-associated protein
LKQLLNDLVVASGTLVEIHGHTDNQGSADGNMKLSEERAFAVKAWLEKQAPSSFPEGRVKVVAHGQTEPVAPNTTEDGRSKNRRVVIVLGTNE